MAPKKKLDSKTYAQQKRHRRKMLTFVRMSRYGVNNFTRNAWLSLAATAVMAVTLFFIFITVAAHSVLSDTLSTVRNKVDISIYLQKDISDGDAAKIEHSISKLKSVREVSYVSSSQGRQELIDEFKSDASIISAATIATNQIPATIHVKMVDINNTSELQNFVKTDPLTKANLDPSRPSTFAGPQSESIKTIGRAIVFAQQVGVGASIIFAALSILVIFNTIRMAIFSRSEEIQMMKLIGAEKSFIRGPFLVEAIVYGFIAALIASALAYTALYFATPGLDHYQITIKPTMEFVTYYAGFVLLAMITAGAIIGVISSLLATRRYLKI